MSAPSRPGLEPDELVDAARVQTGLDDFGGDSYREGLEILTRGMETESSLSTIGRHVARGHVLRLLASRLQIEDWYRKHPEIDAQKTPAPIVVLGLPRTGTTALSALLACDPETRSLRTWESSAPTPPPEKSTEDTDPRIDRARASQEQMHAAFPAMKIMYDAEPTGPTECQDLLGMDFKTEHFCGMYRSPTYAAWVRGCDMTSAYRLHHRTLKLLQWRCPPNRWHLKTPVHMLSLDALDREYPDARFIMTHRDPARVLGSVCSLIQVTRSMASDERDPLELGKEQVDIWSLALERAMAFRGRIGEERFADLPFREQVKDPIGSVERAYAKLGIPFTEAARAGMTSWAAEHRKGRHGEHQYRLADFGLAIEPVRERFRAYVERFDVPLEEGE